ncbi:Hypothetical predicted protein [Cloeon dipterum]|uniref:Uncharacterized protein n=1 Tax=Cloeon dipterum TaxID=197152 RepID=A0A8S1DD39_9INSE|nr:Hypothetical predicted protein [Cloeon dipterum]
MQVVRFNKQNLALICALASVLYFLLHAKTQHIELEYVVDEKAILVWEHVADFNNMMALNPTIVDFDIIEDKGNYKNWQYTVHYTEHLSNFPSIKNKAVGFYTVRPDGSDFLIESTHKTCFYNLYCLSSASEFRFRMRGASQTTCLEKIDFQCPYLFTKICTSEAMHQRAMIRDKLIQFFKENANQA